MTRLRVAVVGHVEWVEFLEVERLPRPGEIIQAKATLEVPAGGGAVAAVALARLGAQVHFFTTLGADALGERAEEELTRFGVDVRATFRSTQRRATTLIDAQRERTILVVGERLVPLATHLQEWSLLAQCDAVYVTGCDAEVLRYARRARVLTATSRVLPLLQQAKVKLDALVGSANDPDERYAPGDLDPAPAMVVRTDGSRGGEYTVAGKAERYAAVPALVTGDTYGAGDTFAAALTFALGEGKSPADATAFAAARAAEVLAFRGPYPP